VGRCSGQGRGEETPPTRVWSEGGVREVQWVRKVRKGKRNPSDSRLEQGRGMRGGHMWWASKQRKKPLHLTFGAREGCGEVQW
jgi:hypothetical protein